MPTARSPTWPTIDFTKTIGHNPATFTYGGIRLHVRAGSLPEGDVAGPITLCEELHLVQSTNGEYYIMSAALNCSPTGAAFKIPLEIDFCVGDELGDDDENDSEEDDEGPERWSCGDEGEEYLRSTYKVWLCHLY